MSLFGLLELLFCWQLVSCGVFWFATCLLQPNQQKAESKALLFVVGGYAAACNCLCGARHAIEESKPIIQ